MTHDDRRSLLNQHGLLKWLRRLLLLINGAATGAILLVFSIKIVEGLTGQFTIVTDMLILPFLIAAAGYLFILTLLIYRLQTAALLLLALMFIIATLFSYTYPHVEEELLSTQLPFPIPLATLGMTIVYWYILRYTTTRISGTKGIVDQ